MIALALIFIGVGLMVIYWELTEITKQLRHIAERHDH